MLIGVPKEVKNHEYRVGLTSEAVAELTRTAIASWLNGVRGSASAATIAPTPPPGPR